MACLPAFVRLPRRLQEVKLVGKLFADFGLDAHADQVGEFVGVLARSWNADGARPVVVQVAQLVRHSLQDVRIKFLFVFQDDVVRRRRGAFADVLRNDVEVVHELGCDDAVDDSAWRSVDVSFVAGLALKTAEVPETETVG